MSGAANLKGLIYQQRYVMFRVLSALGLRTAGTATNNTTILGFSVEGRTTTEGPIWDVRIAFADAMVDLCECKDTEISKDDRLTFYDRLRKEVASGTPADQIRAVWVTDPDKQTPNALAYLEGIATQVTNTDLATVAKTPPLRMNSTADALQEAIYRLCHYTGAEDKKTDLPRRCTLDEAKAILGRLRIDRYRFAELDHAVKLLVTGVLPQGTATAINTFVTGVLTDAIVEKGQAEFTLDSFVEAVGITMVGLDVEGRVRRILSFHAAAGFVPPVRLVEWTLLPGRPTKRWTLAHRAPAYDPRRSSIVVAAMGLGKTVASQLAFEEEAERRAASQVLRIEARELAREDLEAAVRAACLLAGVAPTWLALDGLDEVPQDLRPEWTQAIVQLASLPNLTLFLTVRTEVYAIHEWIGRATAGLAMVEIRPLEPLQVTEAFTTVGLPVPINRRLLQVLQNPFLFSLYAAVVTPGDMPLAESGEATAFLVVDQFWKRHVRGISIGQRAVGNDEYSQEPKRKAAVHLAARALAGDLVTKRESADPQVVAGIEMLRREGVLREHGADAVAWVHDWIREYAIIDCLLSRLNEPSAVSLARQIAADCHVDHVARAAAAGGIKWVVANPESGSPATYLSELWAANRGLAREALAVLLEGSAEVFQLADLSDELLLEALTLAINLNSPQWGAQVAGLPEGRFLGNERAELRALAVEYELRIVPGTGQPAAATVERLVARDLARLRAGGSYSRGAYRLLLEKAVSTDAFRTASVHEWLVATGEVNDSIVLSDLLEAITEKISVGAADVAHEFFRAAAGLTIPFRRKAIAELLVQRRLGPGRGIIDVLRGPQLIVENLDTWGVTSIEFLAGLVEAKQRLDWPSSRRFLKSIAQSLNTPFADDEEFSPEFDQEPRITTLDQDAETPIAQVAAAVMAALQQLADLDDPAGFRRLADAAVQTQFSALAVLPLLTLYDALQGIIHVKPWHMAEISRLLTNATIAEFESIDDVRRLLRRGVPADYDQRSKEAMAAAIRGANVEDHTRTRELSDIGTWGVLTSEEREAVSRATAADEISTPADPRQEPLVTSGRSHLPDRPPSATGWPHPEDDELVRLLARGVTESEAPNYDEATALNLRLQALDVLVKREAALEDEWLGRVLGWCHGAIERLRESVANQNGGQVNSQTWREALDQRAGWWMRVAEAALNRLKAAVPQSHTKEITQRLSWFSGDPIMNAFELLDELLAIDSSLPFDALQNQLTETIAAQWPSWPPFTRAAVLSSLRPWFWYQFPAWRSLLTTIVDTEQNPVVVAYAVEKLVWLAPHTPTPELLTFLRRAASGGHNDALREVSQLFGDCAVRVVLPRANASMQEAAEFFQDALAMDWPDAGALAELLGSALHGATDCLQRNEATPALDEAWLAAVNLIVGRWPFSQLASSNGGRFPVHALVSVLQRNLTPDLRMHLFLGLVPTFDTILRKGDLPEYSDLHHELKGLIAGRRLPVRGGREWHEGILISDPVETALATLCRGSVKRMTAWKAEGKTTDDLGWIDCLDGRASAELIKSCLDASRDRPRMKRELAPLIDLLADSGERRVAADLRTYMRRL